MGRKAIGRAFPIREKDAKSYSRARPGRMRANPMGVTTLARVNGPGAYSARAASAGRSRDERIARARKLVKGTMAQNATRRRASFVSLKKNPKVTGKRLAAFNAARRRGLAPKSAARSAVRKVPFTANERKRKSSFVGVKARPKPMRRNRDTLAEQRRYEEGHERTFGKKKAAPKKAAAKKRTTKKEKPVAAKTTTARGKGRKKGKKKAKKLPPQYKKVRTYKTKTETVKRKKKVPVTRTMRHAYGPYVRAKLLNPRTGRREYSYFYKTKSGQYRRIPGKAMDKHFNGKMTIKRAEAIQKARKRAADRILKEGGVFVMNKRRTKKKATKRTTKFNRKKYYAALRAGYGKRDASKIAYGEKKMARKARSTKKRSTAKRRTRRAAPKRRTTKRRSPKRRMRKNAKRRTTARKGTKRSRAAKKGWATRRRKGTAPKKRRSTKRRSGKRRMKRNAGRRSYAANRRRSYSKNRGRKRAYAANRRRGKRRTRRSYRRNQGFMATITSILKTGALITTGFLAHRVLTWAATEYGLMKLIEPKAGAEVPQWHLTLAKWSKPLVGLPVFAVGVGIANATIKDKSTVMAIGGGMFASLLQSTLVSILVAADQPKVAASVSGYTNSLAYQLRGNRRGMRGLGAMRSIMPQYQQVGMGRTPGFMQAAAGMGRSPQFMQAAAGTGMGEYFQSNAVGEYFAPQSTQGVGAYEQAGPLAMQASAGIGQQPIEDGIRPDADLDRILDLAESAAGLGEYYSAERANSGFTEERVPTQSQWIPHGPLWAGTLGVKDTIQKSELPAGILAGPGGNGVLSGG
jgi:hypothetical protein